MNVFDKYLENGAIYHDPYPIYAHLRKHFPIQWSDILQAWIITRHADIDFGLSSCPVSVKRNSIQMERVPRDHIRTFQAFFAHWLMYQDAPHHLYKRDWAKQLFDRALIEEVVHQTDSVADTLLEQIKTRVEFDLVTDYARKIGLFSVCSLARIAGFEEIVFHLSNRIVNFMQGRYEDFDEAMNQSKEAIEQLESIIVREVLDSLSLSSLTILGKIQDDQSIQRIAISIIGNILVDGHEPIANAIVNSIIALQDFPEQCALIRSNPRTLKRNVDELIRFDPPFQYVVRHAQKDFSIRSTKIEQGNRILFMIASANRDESVFSNPDSINLLNHNKYHRSFGFGSHFCLGATLARKIVTIAIQKFINTIPQFKVYRDRLTRHTSLGSRAIYNAPVSIVV